MDPTKFRQRFADWKAGKKVYDAGKPIEDDYEKFKRTLPPNQRNASEYDYSTRRYWELNGKPKDFDEAIKRKMYTLEDDGFYHANSIAWTPNGDAEFMKPNVHPTKHFEDEFYESNPEFLKKYRRTFDWTRPGFSKYERNISPLDYINLPKYDGGTDDKTYLPEYEYEATVTPQGTSLLKHKRITNKEDWLKYWGNVGAGYVNKALNEVGKLALEGLKEASYFTPFAPLTSAVETGVNLYNGDYLGAGLSALAGIPMSRVLYNKALPTIGRLAKPYTNYFASKALSNAIDGAVRNSLNGVKANAVRKMFPTEDEFNFWHGGLDSDFDFKNLDVLRLGSKQAKRGRDYAGFYMYDSFNQPGAFKYGGGEAHGIKIADNAKIFNADFNTERLSVDELTGYLNLGYDLIKGQNVFGEPEYILLNRDAIKSTKFFENFPGHRIHMRRPPRPKTNPKNLTNEELVLHWNRIARDLSYVPILYDKGKSIKPLPKYDGGENPWIPKGTKVPTENGKEVVVSALPKTTVVSKQRPSIDDNLTEQQRGLAYLRHLYKVDKPLSGEDPIGELAVEGAALGPIFKGLGWVGKQIAKQAMPYIGRALKPVTNWFAAKALSNSIDDAVATPTFSKVLPATEQVWQDLNLPRRSYLSGSMRGPFTEEVFRRNGIFDAFDAFDNPARKQLVDRLSEEAGFPLLISTGHGNFPGTIKILTDSDADKILGKNVFGKRDGYTLYVRESADPTTMFHEALHLQGFGNVDWDFPKLLSLLDDYEKKGLKIALLEKSDAPFMLIRDAKRDYYAAEQAYKQLFKLKTATELFLKLKVESVLRDDAEEYIRQPHEFVVHGLQAGRKVGLKPYQPEPTYDPYNTGVPIVDFGKIMETVHSAIKKHDWMADLKLDTPLDYHNAWKVLTGNFLPAAVITGGTFGALQEHDKGKSIYINPANKGKFNATKKRTGKTTEQLAHSKNPLTRKRAIFALNSRKFKH